MLVSSVNKRRRNKKIGTSAEARYLYKTWLWKYSGSRFYASEGLFDLCFIDSNYVTRLVQVKASSVKGKKPRISPAEIEDIKIYIDQNKLKDRDNIWVGYVLMPSRQPIIEVRLN